MQRLPKTVELLSKYGELIKEYSCDNIVCIDILKEIIPKDYHGVPLNNATKKLGLTQVTVKFFAVYHLRYKLGFSETEITKIFSLGKSSIRSMLRKLKEYANATT